MMKLNILPIGTSSDDYEEAKFCSAPTEWSLSTASAKTRSILTDLRNHTIPDDIKNQADVIYNKMRYQLRRKKVRDQLLFYCVYCAHLELGRDVDPVRLGLMFGLTSGEIQRCDSLFSPLQTGYRPPETTTTPLGYLPSYCNSLNLAEEAIDEIMRLAKSILEKDSSLFQEHPQTVASGLLRYYLITNGIETDNLATVPSVTGRSSATMDTMYKRIAAIDNS